MCSQSEVNKVAGEIRQEADIGREGEKKERERFREWQTRTEIVKVERSLCKNFNKLEPTYALSLSIFLIYPRISEEINRTGKS